jgi:hypothetical protein
MMKKLGIVVMTALFSVSVAGLSFADEKTPAAPAAPAVEKAAPAAAAGEKKMKSKKAKKEAPAKATEVKEVQQGPKRVRGGSIQMRKTTTMEAPAAAPAPAHTPEKK